MTGVGKECVCRHDVYCFSYNLVEPQTDKEKEMLETVVGLIMLVFVVGSISALLDSL